MRSNGKTKGKPATVRRKCVRMTRYLPAGLEKNHPGQWQECGRPQEGCLVCVRARV